MAIVETIVHEHDFKIVCDAVLRNEFGPRVDTFGGKGRDGGIDAEFNGEHRGLSGRWIFQYKFIGPDVDQSRARSVLTRMFAGTTKGTSKRTEFAKPAILDPKPDVYVVLTNVAATVWTVGRIRAAWRKSFSGELLVWDRSALNCMLQDRGFLTRSWDGTKEANCRSLVVAPLAQMILQSVGRRAPL